MKYLYLSRKYLNTLPLKVLYKGLEYINYKYRHAKAAIFTKKNPQGTTLKPYDDNYTAPIQFRVLYCYKIYNTLITGKVLKLWDVHYYWHLKERFVSI